MRMQPKDVVKAWVEAFNRADPVALGDFYCEDAINHQVAEDPVEGRAAIREMFAKGFAMTEMVCVVENIFEVGEWAILEWRDPKGLRGCGFFHIKKARSCFNEDIGTNFLFFDPMLYLWRQANTRTCR